MGKVNQLWQDTLELACTDMLLNRISKDEFRIKCRALGMEEDDIQEHIDAVSFDKDGAPF